MKNNKVTTTKFLNDEEKKPVAYISIKCNVKFEIKMNFEGRFISLWVDIYNKRCL
jgi:hypothetical protein